MGNLTFRSAGESHGLLCLALLEGLPFGLPVNVPALNVQLSRRQQGYGRGARMKLETDRAELLSGVRHGQTTGAPLALGVWNKDVRLEQAPELECPRPGHADLAGHLKYGAPIRDILERASARETTARVAAGALCRQLLAQFQIALGSHVLAIGSAEVPAGFQVKFSQIERADESEVRCLHAQTGERMKEAIDTAKAQGDTLGGIVEIVAVGLPTGLGDHTQWDRRLDGRIAQALMSIQAIKGVEIGLGFASARRLGSQTHDPIEYAPQAGPSVSGGFIRPSNGAGGLEGGITNGAPLVVRVAMKPIATLMKPLASVNLRTRAPMKASVERSDVCAVPAAGVVAENFLAFVLAQALCEKLGGDSLPEMKRNFQGYCRQISTAPAGGSAPSSLPAEGDSE